MKTDILLYNDVEIESTCDKQMTMRLSDKAQGTIFQMFTKNVYSNPIGTVVREITSNAFDSHVEAKSTNPVIIKHTIDITVDDEKNETKQHYLSFIDSGVGMSPHRVENIYGVYFESTKNQDNDQIGGFGIGGKTPLAYTDIFFVTTRYNGIEYQYEVYKGKEAPGINLTYERSTTESNGTEIRIPILEKDLNKFVHEIKRQLYYFENIVYVGFDVNENLNEYQIYKGKNFIFRGKTYSDNVHVCLGKVAYPIDFSVLGVSAWDNRIPIALQFNVGEIGVTVSRESLDYSDATIKLIKTRIEEAKKEIIAMIQKQYENVVTLQDYYNANNTIGSLMLSENIKIDVSCCVNKKDCKFINFKYRDLPFIPSEKQIITTFFSVKEYGNGSKSRYGRKQFNLGLYDNIIKSDIYQCTEFNRKVIKQSYLNWIHDKSFYVIKPYKFETTDDLKNNEEIISNFFNFNFPSDETYDMIHEIKDEVVNWVTNNVLAYDDIVIPDAFIKDRKKEKLSKDILSTTIVVNTFSGWNHKERVDIKTLNEYNGSIYYGTTDDDSIVRMGNKLFIDLFGNDTDNYLTYTNRFKRKKGVVFLIVSKTNEKYIKMCKNVRHISTLYPTMLHRKLKVNPTNYSIAKSFLNRVDSINDLYRNPAFTDITLKMNIIEKEYETLKTLYDGYDKISFESSLIKPYIKSTKSDLKIKSDKLVHQVLAIQEMNADTLKWIEMPYRVKTIDLHSGQYISLFNILKSVMVFK